MNNYSPIINISNALLDKNINVLYFRHNTLFDILIKEINATFCHNDDIVKQYYYDMSFSNNLFTYDNDVRTTATVGHIKSLVGIHSAPPPNFKKEDLFLMSNNTRGVHKFFFGEDIANAWRATNSDHILVTKYGIPLYSFEEKRDNDILIINLENNPQIELLYNTIIKKFPSTNILKSIDSSITPEIMSKYLHSYKICIDPLHRINALFSASCGCVTITSTGIVSDQNDLIVPIDNYGLINNIIESLLNNQISEETRKNNAQLIGSAYNYDEFKTTVFNKIATIKQDEIFLL